MASERSEKPGLMFGIVLAWGLTAFLSLSVLIHLVLRAFFGDAVPLPLDQVPLIRLVLGYAVGGITAGLILDYLLPRAERRIEAALTGVIGAVPFFVAIRVAIKGSASWAPDELVRLGILALVVGVVSSRVLWRGDVRQIDGDGESRSWTLS